MHVPCYQCNVSCVLQVWGVDNCRENMQDVGVHGSHSSSRYLGEAVSRVSRSSAAVSSPQHLSAGEMPQRNMSTVKATCPLQLALQSPDSIDDIKIKGNCHSIDLCYWLFLSGPSDLRRSLFLSRLSHHGMGNISVLHERNLSNYIYIRCTLQSCNVSS